jgi:hypothetical protein
VQARRLTVAGADDGLTDLQSAAERSLDHLSMAGIAPRQQFERAGERPFKVC